MEQLAAAKIANFNGPFRVRQRDECWTDDDDPQAAFSADFVHKTAIVHQCTCWRLAHYFHIYTKPPSFKTLICSECKSTPFHVDDIPKTVRIYFDITLRPITSTLIGRSEDDEAALQPSSNNSSC